MAAHTEYTCWTVLASGRLALLNNDDPAKVRLTGERRSGPCSIVIH